MSEISHFTLHSALKCAKSHKIARETPKNRLRLGLRPRPRWRSLRRSAVPLVSDGRGDNHSPSPSTPSAAQPRAPPMLPESPLKLIEESVCNTGRRLSRIVFEMLMQRLWMLLFNWRYINTGIYSFKIQSQNITMFSHPTLV